MPSLLRPQRPKPLRVRFLLAGNAIAAGEIVVAVDRDA